MTDSRSFGSTSIFDLDHKAHESLDKCWDERNFQARLMVVADFVSALFSGFEGLLPTQSSDLVKQISQSSIYNGIWG